MLFPQIKRSDPEQIFGIFKNGEATAMVHGDCVIHSTAAYDGVTVLYSTTTAANGLLVAGVVHGDDIAAGDYGMVLVYGYHGSVKAIAGVTAGAAIICCVTTGRSASIGATADDPLKQFGCALTATSSSRIKAFLRCM